MKNSMKIYQLQKNERFSRPSKRHKKLKTTNISPPNKTRQKSRPAEPRAGTFPGNSLPHCIPDSLPIPAALQEIVSGAVVNPPKDFQAGIIPEDPGLQGAPVAGLHRGALGAVLDPAQRQARLRGDVQERAPLENRERSAGTPPAAGRAGRTCRGSAGINWELLMENGLGTLRGQA